jgi:hypothetical protein
VDLLTVGAGVQASKKSKAADTVSKTPVAVAPAAKKEISSEDVPLAKQVSVISFLFKSV